jgi:hypothetical protein
MKKQSKWRVVQIANDGCNRNGSKLHSFREDPTSYFTLPFSNGSVEVRSPHSVTHYVTRAERPDDYDNWNPEGGYKPQL